MTLIDSHCHLDFPDFESELDDVVRRAREAGVSVMQTICTRLSAFQGVLAVARRYDGIFCSVGVHPHHVDEEAVGDGESLVALSAEAEVIGIGESGLDYYYDNSPRDLQRASFRAHIAAARTSGLPLIVHTRGADDDTMAILSDEMQAGPFSGLIHCFSTGRALAEATLELGFYISLSGIVTFKNAESLRAIVRDLPLDRLLVETDAPYLSPMPRRGHKPNEPSFVVHTAACVAELKGLDTDSFAAATSANFFALFQKAQPGTEP